MAVQNWLERPDLATARVQEFIRLAEAHFSRNLYHWRMEKRSETTVGERYVSLPVDFLDLRRLHIVGKGRNLVPVASGQMQTMHERNNFAAGEPTHYCLIGGEIELYPQPDENYRLQMTYREPVPALTVNNTTNWLLTEAPDLYLYGALMSAAPYYHHDDRLPTFASLVRAAIDGLNRQSENAGVGAGVRVRVGH